MFRGNLLGDGLLNGGDEIWVGHDGVPDCGLTHGGGRTGLLEDVQGLFEKIGRVQRYLT